MFNSFSKKLEVIRNKVESHIDPEYLFDPQKAYREANITYAELDAVIKNLWNVMQVMYKEKFGRNMSYDEYDGNDINKILKSIEYNSEKI